MLHIVEEALEWILNIASDNTHGYSQTNRWGPDYDCSSLVISAWQSIGVPVKTNGATYTGDMYDVFIATGFEDVTDKVNLDSAIGAGMLAGDVLLNPGVHTAMFIGNAQIVHASSDKGHPETGDQDGGEICVRSYYKDNWKVLRWTK